MLCGQEPKTPQEFTGRIKSPDLNPAENVYHWLNEKVTTKMPQEQPGTKDSYREDTSPASSDVCRSRVQSKMLTQMF